MPPSMESSTSSESSEPVTPPFNRNATCSASRSGAALTPDKQSTPTNGTTTPLSLRKRFASFTRSSGKAASGMLSAGPTPPATTPLSDTPPEEMAERIEKLDLQKGAAVDTTSTLNQQASASTTSLGEPKEAQDVFSSAYTFHSDGCEDSPLQRVLKSPNAVSFIMLCFLRRQGASRLTSWCSLMCSTRNLSPVIQAT